ncbi:MAG TPA: rhomboid family intramembrane serine protease [Bacteriovoracaceae bacterium]|nr:rhomboid family intramembrane serine protease [Bacteriovoracaceae bacterium]
MNQAPPLSKVNKIILISAGTGFLLCAIMKAIGAFSLVQILGLSGTGLFSGMVWQLLTYPLVETEFMSFLFNSLLIWFVGSELETLWGSKIYLRFLLMITFGVGLIYCAVGLLFFFGTSVYLTPIQGLTGVNFALLIAYAMLYPDRQLSMMMIFPMRAKTFCWILVAIQAYFAIFSSHITAWAHLLAMGISYLIIRFQSQPLIKKVLNSTWTPSKTKKKHLYVVKDDDQKPPKYWQ